MQRPLPLFSPRGEEEEAEKLMKKKITRRVFCSMLLALPFSARAQQPAKIPRIGFVTGGIGDANNRGPNFETFRKALRDRDYAEGKNLTVEYRSAEGKGVAYEAQLAEELVRLKVDVSSLQLYRRSAPPRRRPKRFRLS
jgi:hypothetical protein